MNNCNSIKSFFLCVLKKERGECVTYFTGLGFVCHILQVGKEERGKDSSRWGRIYNSDSFFRTCNLRKPKFFLRGGRTLAF